MRGAPPQRIGAGHVGEESGDVRIERGPTRAIASRALSPPPTQPGAMPSDDGLGVDEDQCRPPPAPGGRQQDPQHPVTGDRASLHAEGDGHEGGRRVRWRPNGDERCLSAAPAGQIVG